MWLTGLAVRALRDLNGGEGRDDPFGVRTQRFGVVERAAGGLQRYARPARQQMEMQVKHLLPAGGLIELLDGEALGPHAGLDRERDLLHRRHEAREIPGRDVE